MTEKFKIALGRSENIVGQEENDDYQDFLLFPQFFEKFAFLGLLKVELCGKELNKRAKMALDRSPDFLKLLWPFFFFFAFREEFTRISLCLYSARSPYFMFIDRSKFEEQF